MNQKATSSQAPHVLCVLEAEQQVALSKKLDLANRPGVRVAFDESADDALERLASASPALVLVGMSLDTMEGLEFVAHLLKRNPGFDGKVVVVPDDGDPFPPVAQYRDAASGRSVTQETDLSTVSSWLDSLAGVAKPAFAKPASAAAAPAPAPPAAPVKKAPAPAQVTSPAPAPVKKPPAPMEKSPAPAIRSAADIAPAGVKPSAPRPAPAAAKPLAAGNTVAASGPDPATAAPAVSAGSPAVQKPAVAKPAAKPVAVKPLAAKPIAAEPVRPAKPAAVASPAVAPPVAAALDAAGPPVAAEPPVAAKPTVPAPPAIAELVAAELAAAAPAPDAAAPLVPVEPSAGAGSVEQHPPGTSRPSRRRVVVGAVIVGIIVLLILLIGLAATGRGATRSTKPARAATPAKPAVARTVTRQVGTATHAQAAPAAQPDPDLDAMTRLPFHFDKGSAQGTVQSANELAKLVALIRRRLGQEPAKSLEVGGHASSEGPEYLQSRLGRERAEYLARYLEKHGIPEERIALRNYAATRPVMGKDGEDLAASRRVTVRLVDKRR